MVVGLGAPEHVAANAYWQKVKPVVDWQFMLCFGHPDRCSGRALKSKGG
jgi:hypothetical protein